MQKSTVYILVRTVIDVLHWFFNESCWSCLTASWVLFVRKILPKKTSRWLNLPQYYCDIFSCYYNIVVEVGLYVRCIVEDKCSNIEVKWGKLRLLLLLLLQIQWVTDSVVMVTATGKYERNEAEADLSRSVWLCENTLFCDNAVFNIDAVVRICEL